MMIGIESKGVGQDACSAAALTPLGLVSDRLIDQQRSDAGTSRSLFLNVRDSW